MRTTDLFRFSFAALTGHRLRTGLSLLGLAIGVTAVVLLTALGEGARRYVVDQFASLGTNLVVVLPGKTETSGSMGIGGVPNDLTLEDARAIRREVVGAHRVAPLSMATAEASAGERRREIVILGTTASYHQVQRLTLALGEFLPDEDWSRGAAVAVIGSKLADELFPNGDAIGRPIRVDDRRLRVIGILASEGMKLGFDFDELAIVPVATSMQVFNRSSLFRILVQADESTHLDSLKDRLSAYLTARHGEEDITVITQDAVLTTFDSILGALTLALAAIAAVSLTVAGIGIMNVMLVSVSERTSEVGLLKALGAGRRQILGLFLAEAAVLSTCGGLLGLAIGWLLVKALVRVYPALPAAPPSWAIVAALAVSIGTGLVFGVLPARKAAALDPIVSLRTGG